MGRLSVWLLTGCVCINAVAGTPATADDPSAEEIVERNVAARGGLEAWRRITTMSWIGHVETGAASGAAVPFVLEMKRPNKTRFLINSPQMMSVRVFDGTRGWKLRMASGSAPILQPYSAREVAFALDGQVIDGPLIDYQAKGAHVVREGIDEIDGNRAYRIGVKLRSGMVHHVWIDARSYLDLRDESEFRNAFGQRWRVTKSSRDYRDVDGLQIPFVIESRLADGRVINRMVIEKLVLNPPLDDQIFGKPGAPEPQQMLVNPRATGLAVIPAADVPDPAHAL